MGGDSLCRANQFASQTLSDYIYNTTGGGGVGSEDLLHQWLVPLMAALEWHSFVRRNALHLTTCVMSALILSFDSYKVL